jgi:hypothetical protein
LVVRSRGIPLQLATSHITVWKLNMLGSEKTSEAAAIANSMKEDEKC